MKVLGVNPNPAALERGLVASLPRCRSAKERWDPPKIDSGARCTPAIFSVKKAILDKLDSPVALLAVSV